MKTVLLTGSRGYLGFEYSKYLRKKGIRVLGVDLSDSKHKDDIKVESLRELNSIKDLSVVSNIIHLSAVSGISDAEKDPERCIRNNIYELSILLEIIFNKKINIQNFLFVSSADALNVKNNFKSNADIYSLSKFIGELIVNYYSGKLNIKIAILRFTSLYGFFDKANKKVLSKFVSLAINNKPIIISNNDTFNFLHYKDAISALDFSTSYLNRKTEKIEEFNFFSNENISLIELANKIKKIVNSKSKILIENVDIKNTNFYNFGNKPLDWQQKISLNEGISSMVKAFKSYGTSIAK